MAREDKALHGYYNTGGKAAGIMTTAATNTRDLCDYFLAAARARVLGRLVAVVGVDTAATAPASGSRPRHWRTRSADQPHNFHKNWVKQ